MAENTIKAAIEDKRTFLRGTGKPSVTRGLVISLDDPLNMGRVRVFIPGTHGPQPYEIPESESTSLVLTPEAAELQSLLPRDENGNFLVVLSGDWKGMAQRGAVASKDSEDLTAKGVYPWARVLGHSWGPSIKNLNDPTVRILSGVFNIPKVGTEVILIFENDDPNLPIVVGAISQTEEFRYLPTRPIESSPGSSIINPVRDADTLKYSDVASSVYSIVTPSSGGIYISDIKDKEVLMFSGLAPNSSADPLKTYKEFRETLKYPFPTRASSPYSSRIPLTPTSVIRTFSGPSTQELIKSSSATTNTETTTPVSETTNNEQADATIVYRKRWPITINPVISSQVYAVRSGENGKQRYHTGVDIATTEAREPLVAPINGHIVYIGLNSKSAGNYITFLGMDGIAHCFMHLDSVSQTAKVAYANKTLVLMDTELGKCGNTGRSYGKNGGWHLHWEVFNPKTSNLDAVEKYRIQVMHPAAYNLFNDIEAAKKIILNPVVWLTGAEDSSGKVSHVVLTQEQAAAQYKQLADDNPLLLEYSRPNGLECSMVAGKETLSLRHPSGSFISIDPDGNIIFYSVGDVIWKVHRSWKLDVFGAIFESALARFSRIKTVCYDWAQTPRRGLASIFKNKENSKNPVLPKYFFDVDEMWRLDAENAIKSLAPQIVDTGTAATAATAGTTSQFQTPPNPGVAKRDFSITTYDSDIKKYTAQYLKSGIPGLFDSMDARWIKALVTIESNNRPKKAGLYYGLMQIGETGVADVLGETALPKTFDMESFNSTKPFGLDYGLQYFKKCADRMYSVTKGELGVTLESQELKYLTTFAYNIGYTAVAKYLRLAVQKNMPVSYASVESLYASANLEKDGKTINKNALVHLEYVPNIVEAEKKIKLA